MDMSTELVLYCVSEIVKWAVIYKVGMHAVDCWFVKKGRSNQESKLNDGIK